MSLGVSYLRSGAIGAALVALCAAGGSFAASRSSGSIQGRKEPINWSADSADLDTVTHRGILHGHVQVAQGDITVAADQAEASGIGLPDGRWIFTGNVHIRSGQRGQLSSDRATVEFRDKLLSHAVVTGSPAQFEQTASTTGLLARGHADIIDYDVARGIVRLSDHAWLTNGPDQTNAAMITYDVRGRKVRSEGNAIAGPVHSVVVPKPKPDPIPKKTQPSKP